MKKEEMQQVPEKSQERLQVLQRIEEYEKLGKFDIDVEYDPQGKELLPDKIDYLRESLFAKIKVAFANMCARKYINKLIKEKKLLIKSIGGIENWKQIPTGAVITCNHFSANDSFIMQKVFEASGKRKMYKVIREGNYTNPPCLKFFMQNCDVLPLSSNIQTMKKFIHAVDTILQRGDNILIYPEESMWWNYRKPKPLKTGAFKFAVKNNVHVVPIFITMEDTDSIGVDGFPIQNHTVHVLTPIYPKPELNKKENIEYMRKANYDAWVKVYEQVYGKKLEYTTEGEIDFNK